MYELMLRTMHEDSCLCWCLACAFCCWCRHLLVTWSVSMLLLAGHTCSHTRGSSAHSHKLFAVPSPLADNAGGADVEEGCAARGGDCFGQQRLTYTTETHQYSWVGLCMTWCQDPTSGPVLCAESLYTQQSHMPHMRYNITRSGKDVNITLCYVTKRLGGAPLQERARGNWLMGSGTHM